MTDAKRPWTAGPWLMRKADGYDNVFEIGLSKFGLEGLGLSGVRDNSYMYVHGSMIEADARLISAAPDMAEALVRLVERAEETIGCIPASAAASARSGGAFNFSISNEIVMAARAALRKSGMEGV